MSTFDSISHFKEQLQAHLTNTVIELQEVTAIAPERQTTEDTYDTNRPTFAVKNRGTNRLENEFEPRWSVRQFSGDPVPDIEWRIRGPRFSPIMDWKYVTGSQLEGTRLTSKFDLSRSVESGDEVVELDQVGLELRTSWRGLRRYKLHRFPIKRSEHPGKILWDVGREKLSPIYSDGPDE